MILPLTKSMYYLINVMFSPRCSMLPVRVLFFIHAKFSKENCFLPDAASFFFTKRVCVLTQLCVLFSIHAKFSNKNCGMSKLEHINMRMWLWCFPRDIHIDQRFRICSQLNQHPIVQHMCVLLSFLIGLNRESGKVKHSLSCLLNWWTGKLNNLYFHVFILSIWPGMKTSWF